MLLAKNDALTHNGDIFKTGRVRVSLKPNLFIKGKSFLQTMDMKTGSVQIEAAKHDCEITRRDFININYKIHSVGGDNSRGVRTHKKHTINGNEVISFAFNISPIL